MKKFYISPYKLAKKLMPINRSLISKGNVKTLRILKKINKDLKIKKIKSGTKVFDWRIPNEWVVNHAFIVSPDGKRIFDYKRNNLRLLGYSCKIKKKLNLKELKKKLFVSKLIKNAIPYVTSYYKKDWGFCVSQNEKLKLKKGKYLVNIDTEFKKTSFNYGEIFKKGKSKKEIIFSTYICHPSLANNEISGPVVAIYLSKFIEKLNNKFSYRFIFSSETVGTIGYIQRNLSKLKKNTLAGFILTCVGDEKNYSFMPSKYGNTITDRISRKILKRERLNVKFFNWKDRGSDERQYCSPGVDLPFCSIMRSKYGEYKEYHTSMDQIGKVVTSKGLQGSLKIYKRVIKEFEKLDFPLCTKVCEPFLTKYKLYPTTSHLGIQKKTSNILDYLSYSDGTNSTNDIQKILKISKNEINYLTNILIKNKLITLN